ncbi:hypothetical protein BKE30_04890 [Alkanindiges hydrocarboniclasticus]|uniref:Uncharacterized protein n=1 Tax=Alkanindiges hydrocarboniclasticus TaxID=1907941 RepID=A0A1S8CWH5_9GAMM|nr:hypothetical protein [Alkanindiges hydrocarboniclasticus]ONG41384.1 hypothetical protein BKE30_04890 [Alkanindiges hydrocarboniclasticus]
MNDFIYSVGELVVGGAILVMLGFLITHSPMVRLLVVTSFSIFAFAVPCIGLYMLWSGPYLENPIMGIVGTIMFLVMWGIFIYFGYLGILHLIESVKMKDYKLWTS